MAYVRDSFNRFRTESLEAAAAVDASTYDYVGRYNGVTAAKCGASEVPQFIFLDSITSAEILDGKKVPVAFLGSGQVSVKVFGNVSAGQKLAPDSSGHIVASGTAADAALGTYDFAIALESGSDGDEILIDVLRWAQ